MKKLNCWEHKECGREPKGSNVSELGVCPATTEKEIDGVHGGKNGGRACWIVTGTLSDGKVQGNFQQKFTNCYKCDFYNIVKSEENGSFEFITTIVNRLGLDTEKK